MTGLPWLCRLIVDIVPFVSGGEGKEGDTESSEAEHVERKLWKWEANVSRLRRCSA